LIFPHQTSPINIIQGPLAGISSAPFRLLVTEYGAPAFSYTEMISCKTLMHKSSAEISPFLAKLNGEGPMGVQLSGTSTTDLAEAVRIATANGADTIDLNCGCPVTKIRRRGAGSAHLNDPARLARLIDAMKQNTSLPVSIKIRVDGPFSEKNNQHLIEMIRNSGLDFLIVHGRNWQDTYETPCRYEEIKFFVNSLKIPVIGNGDISDGSSLANMLDTGCAGVMISRASVGQPWLIKNLLAELKDEPIIIPTSQEIGAIFYRHVELLATFLGKELDALRQSRKFCKYYARNQPWNEAFCYEIYNSETLNQLAEIVKKYFG